MNEEQIESSPMSSQQIFEHLKSIDQVSGNPFEIIQRINTFDKGETNEYSDINDEYLNLVSHFDYTFEKVDIKVSEDELDKLMNDLINSDQDINDIKFDSDHQNIFEIEEPINLDTIEKYQEDITPEYIHSKISDSDKKNGSNIQRTISVYDLYETSSLYFKDEAQELANIIIHKLLSYWEVIIDFDRIENLSDSFLKYSFHELCRYLTPKQILERVQIVNISDEEYVKIIRVHLPNSFKVWSSTKEIEQNVDFEKLELIKQLDPESKLVLDSPEHKSVKGIPFEKIDAKFLGRKREKKLRYPVYFIETVTGNLIKEFEIDEKVYKYIESITTEVNWEEVDANNRLRTGENYKYQIPETLFNDVKYFTEHIILEACDLYLKEHFQQIESIKKEIEYLKTKIPKKLIDNFGSCFQTIYLDDKMIKSLPANTRVAMKRIEELEFDLMDREHKYIIKEDILKNIFEIIGFSCYTTGLDKINLITYHYIANYYEKLAIEYKKERNLHMIRSYVIPLEVFRYDLVKILCQDDCMRKFIFTMKELIMKWVYKYAYNSRLAKMYFDILMITPEMLGEMIIRYLAMSIIKNKNPMTLRAIYSTYISLVHTIIYANFNFTDFSKKKYGYFESLSKYQDKNINDKLLVNNSKVDTLEIDALFKCYMAKNPKKLNENYHLLRRLNISKLLEFNTLRVLSTKPKDIGVYDWYYYYARYLQHYEDVDNTVYKINSLYIKSDKKSQQYKYIHILTTNILMNKLLEIVKDYNCVEYILGVIAEDISMRSLNRGYMDKDFKLVVKSNKEYLDYIHDSLIEIVNRL